MVCDELDDCVGEYDSCGICEGADGNLDCLGECSGGFSAGSFMLSISTDDNNDESYSLEAMGDNWSLIDCTNFDGSGGDLTDPSFTGDCILLSDVFNGEVNITLSISDLATGTGTISLSGENFEAEATGVATAETIDGVLVLSGSVDEFYSGGAIVDCAGECDGDAVEDECGVCNGDGPDEYYDCDGNCLTDEDGDLVCDEFDD